MELFAGTEPSCIGTETWTRNGMYFFPDTCFYEFIPEQEMEHNLSDPTYQPKTYLMDEVIPGEKYEVVISVLKGGAFCALSGWRRLTLCRLRKSGGRNPHSPISIYRPHSYDY